MRSGVSLARGEKFRIAVKFSIAEDRNLASSSPKKHSKSRGSGSSGSGMMQGILAVLVVLGTEHFLVDTFAKVVVGVKLDTLNRSGCHHPRNPMFPRRKHGHCVLP